VFISSSVHARLVDYKSLCAAFTVYAILVDPKLEFYILTSVTSKVGRIEGECIGASTPVSPKVQFW